MTKQFFWGRIFAFLLVFSLVLSPTASAIVAPARVAQAAPATQPVVAIHVSELTQALDVAGQFHTTWWHYFVIPESLKIALESGWHTLCSGDRRRYCRWSADGWYFAKIPYRLQPGVRSRR